MTNRDPYAALPPVLTFTLTSADVKDGEALPLEHRSAGAGGHDVSPQLSWSGAPDGTRSYAITLYDADAPTPSGFWHWAVVDLPASVRSLPRGAGAAGGAALPVGAVQLPNDARVASYLGAAPPPGDGAHRYFLVVHALDVETLPVPRDGSPAYLSFVMRTHTLARATLVFTAQPSVKLYASPLACSGAAHLVLLELGVPHTVEFVDIYAHPHVLLDGGAVYSALNPKDAVPALELAPGELLTEVGVILQWLCDRAPESTLLPRFGSLARYRVMEWLSYVGSDFHKTIGPLFNPAMPEAGKALHRQKLHRTMRIFEQRLSRAPYLAGEDFTVADAYLFVMIGWPPYFKVDLREFPNLTRYHARISQRPSVLRMQELVAPVLTRLKLPAFPDFATESRR